MIDCQIVNQEKELFSKKAIFISLRTIEGELGIAPGHAPLLASLVPGVVEIKLEDQSIEFFYVSGGILEIQASNVTILADTAVSADDLNEESEHEEEGKLRARGIQPQASDWRETSRQLAETAARIRAAQLIKKSGRNAKG